MADGFSLAGAAAPFVVTEADRQALAAAIDPDELTALALALGNIPSPAGHEQATGDFVFDWLAKEGFAPRKVGATPERSNIIGTYGGAGSSISIGGGAASNAVVGGPGNAVSLQPRPVNGVTGLALAFGFQGMDIKAGR